MSDAYSCFEELAKHHPEDIDFRICVTDRSSPVSILAPHGGKIEPGTSEIATAIAGDNYSLYVFEGLMSANNSVLHITSEKFDEPRARSLVEKSDIAIAVHGRRDDGGGATWLGGRDTRLRDAIGASLKQATFDVALHHNLPGIKPDNICNRGRTGAGVQLELPKSLRKELLQNPSRLQTFAVAVQSGIDQRKA